MLFHGELELSSDPESRLVVTLTMEPDSLSLATGEEKLGTWNRPEAKAVEVARGRYDLTLGNETLVFTPENGPLFASRGLPYFNEPQASPEPAGLLAKIKKWGLKPADFATQLQMTPDVVSPESEPDLPVGPLDAAATSPRDGLGSPDQTVLPTQTKANPSAGSVAVELASSSPEGHHSRATGLASGSMPITETTPAQKQEQNEAGQQEPSAQPVGETPIRGPLATSLTGPSERAVLNPPAPPRGPQPTDRPAIQMATTEPAKPVTIPMDTRPRTIHRLAFEPNPTPVIEPTEPAQVTKPAPAIEPTEPAHVTKPAPVIEPTEPAQVTPTVAAALPGFPAIPDLAGLLARLDSAVHDLQEGRMEPARGRAIADVVRAMCLAVEVSGGAAKGLFPLADKLDDGARLGDDVIEDQE